MQNTLKRHNWRQAIARQRLARSRRRAFAMVEFAMVVPIVVVLVMGVIQYGMLAQCTAIVTNLSQEGARFGTTSASGRKDADIVDYVKQAAQSTPIEFDLLTVTVSPADNPETPRQVGDPLTVTVEYDMKNRVFPGTAFLLAPYRSGSTYKYKSSAKMRILNP